MEEEVRSARKGVGLFPHGHKTRDILTEIVGMDRVLV